jgi:hypothetical protein
LAGAAENQLARHNWRSAQTIHTLLLSLAKFGNHFDGVMVEYSRQVCMGSWPAKRDAVLYCGKATGNFLDSARAVTSSCKVLQGSVLVAPGLALNTRTTKSHASPEETTSDRKTAAIVWLLIVAQRRS